MNDEKFELTISDLAGSGTYYADIADELRARDTAQREALALVEAERDSAQLSVELWKEQYQSVVDCGNEILTERDTAQAELVEAVGLLSGIQHSKSYAELESFMPQLDAFLARHAQAEQKEAQGAQAGDELIRKVAVALARSPEITPDEARSVRAALATQPAAGEPIAWMHEDELPEGYPYDAMFPFSKVDFVRMFPVFAPPAAAHGDEAVRKDAERYQVLRDMTEGLDATVDAMIAEAAAMLAHGDGEVQ